MYSVGFALREDTEASPTPCDRPFQHTFLPPCVSVELQPPSPLLLRAGLLLSLGRRKPPQCTCRTSLKRAGGDGLTSIPADRESWGGGGERWLLRLSLSVFLYFPQFHISRQNTGNMNARIWQTNKRGPKNTASVWHVVTEVSGGRKNSALCSCHNAAPWQIKQMDYWHSSIYYVGASRHFNVHYGVCLSPVVRALSGCHESGFC